MGVIMHDDVRYGGTKGDRGITPSITATATVDANVGTPSVQVVQTGTDENPNIAFNFSNLKGEQGDIGPDNEGLIRDTVGWIGKNLLVTPYYHGMSREDAGITYTVDGTGRVTADGTASNWSNFWLENEFKVKAGTYILTGIPETENEVYIAFEYGGTTHETITKNIRSTRIRFNNDTTVLIRITIKTGEVVNNLVFEPMLRLASISDDTYEPYHDSVEDELDSILEEVTDTEPYTLRQSLGNLADMEIEGGSVAWNQLVQNGNFVGTTGWASNNGTISASNNVLTFKASARYANVFQNIAVNNNHKYLFTISAKSYTNSNTMTIVRKFTSISPATYTDEYKILTTSKATYSMVIDSASCVRFGIMIQDNNTADWDNIELSNCMLIDLTQMFGSTIADYIYSLEQATAGAGVAWFRKHFPNEYYAYNAGSIQSVCVGSRKVVGKNLLTTPYSEGNRTVNGITYTILGDGTVVCNGTASANSAILLKNYTDLLSLLTKYKNYNLILNGSPSGASNNTYAIQIWDDIHGSKKDIGTGVSISTGYFDGITNGNIAISIASGQTVNNLVFKPMIRLATVEDATYKPYTETTYPFDSSKQLRGIPKLVNNKLSYDGDIYTSDGQITRKYEIQSSGFSRGSLDSSNKLYNCGIVNGAKTNAPGLTNILTDVGWVVTTLENCRSLNIPCCTVYSQRLYVGGYVGNESALDTLLASLNLVYELATPTTESATPYQNPQRAFSDGTEEFIDGLTRDVMIPVGNTTTYQKNVTLPPIEDYVDEMVSGTVQDVYGVMGENGAKNKAKSFVNNNSGTQYYGALYIEGDLQANTEYNIRFKATTGNVYYTNNNLFTEQKVITATGGVDVVKAKTVAVISKSTAGQYENGYGWQILKNSVTQSNPNFSEVMIYDASDTDPTYQPYAMTNKELTNSKADTKDVLQMLSDTVGWTGKNLCPLVPFYSSNGVTLTRTNEGYALLNGTPSQSHAYPVINTTSINDLSHTVLKAGTSIIPSTGTNYKLQFRYSDGSYSDWLTNGEVFTTPKDVAVVLTDIPLSGGTLTDVPFYPMIRLASVTDDTFEPYHQSVEDTLRDAEVIEGKNLIPLTISAIKSMNSDGTWSGNVYTRRGVTYTIVPYEDDYVARIIVNGTATGGNSLLQLPIVNVSEGSYLGSSGIAYAPATAFIQARVVGNPYDYLSFNANGVAIDNKNIDQIYCAVISGNSVSNVSLYPMIRKATETDPTYEPYYVPLKDVVPTKANNSAIAPVINQDTAPRNIAQGEHFMRNGQFCTAKTAIASGATLTENSNYTVGDVVSAFLPLGRQLSSSDNLNNVTETGLYTITTQPANSPESYCGLIVLKTSGNALKQMIFSLDKIYTRSYGGSPASWKNWYKYEGTVVS